MDVEKCYKITVGQEKSVTTFYSFPHGKSQLGWQSLTQEKENLLWSV